MHWYSSAPLALRGLHGSGFGTVAQHALLALYFEGQRILFPVWPLILRSDQIPKFPQQRLASGFGLWLGHDRSCCGNGRLRSVGQLSSDAESIHREVFTPETFRPHKVRFAHTFLTALPGSFTESPARRNSTVQNGANWCVKTAKQKF